jgi:hypothetical protein
MGKPWQDSSGVAAGTGPLRQDSRNLDQTAKTGEPGQNRKDKSGHDSNTRTAASVQLGRKSQVRTARKDSQDSTSRTGNREQYCHNRTASTGQGNRTTVTGQLSKDIWDRTTQTGQPGQV